MSESEHPPDDDEPAESIDNALEPATEFGAQEESAQAQEWEEDAREGGE